jgi:hypothetical protein
VSADVGAKLALAAYAYANTHKLKPVPRALLAYMALRALDEDSGSGQKAGRSFMKRSALGVGIGRMMADREPSADAPAEERKAWDADDQAISRALRSLKAVNAIREISSGHSGRTSEFDICLGKTTSAALQPDSKNVPLSPTKNEPVGVRSMTRRGTLSVPPRNQMNQEEQWQRQTPNSEPSHLPLPTRANYRSGFCSELGHNQSPLLPDCRICTALAEESSAA